MKIIVGTQNKAKIDAVKEILRDYPHLAEAEVIGANVESGVSNQPLSLDETTTGAMNRAMRAFTDCDYSIGIESGLMRVAAAKSGYLDICACIVYDGMNHHLGISSAWEFPDTRIFDMLTKEGMEMTDAIKKIGLTEKENISSEEGAVGIVTQGRVDRKEYTKQGLRMALVHLDIKN